MRIASYNIRKCIGLDRRRRPGRIIDVLNSTGADVIMLQEADRRLGNRPAALPAAMIEEHTDFAAVTLGQSDDSLGWHGNAALVRKGVQTSHHRQIDLPGTEPRGAISITVGEVTIIGAHLGLRRSDRRKQARTLADLANGHDKTVVIGDFNEWSQKRGLEAFEEAMDMVSPGHSFHAARPVAALDRLVYSKSAKVTDCGVVETRLSKIASDHLPIWADFSFDA